MNDINTIPTKRLRRYQKMFERGTSEWYEIQQELEYREWVYLYGKESADDMQSILSKLSPLKDPDLLRDAEQLECFVADEE